MNFTRSQLFGATTFVLLGFGIVASECRTRQIVRNEIDEAYKEEWDASVHGNRGLGHVGSWAPLPAGNGPLFGQNGIFTSGEGRISPIVRSIEPTHDIVLVDAGSTITHYIPVGTGDCLAAATTGLLELPDAANGINGVAWGNNQWFGCSNQSGVFTWPDGGTVNSVNLYSAGSLLQDASLALVWDSGPAIGLGSLGYQCTVGQQAYCEDTLSADFVGQTWAANGTPAVLAVNPATLSTTVASNTIVAIQANYGAFALGTNIVSITLPGGVACTSPTRWTDGIAYCTVLAGTYSAASGTVTVTLATPSNNPFGYTTIASGGSFAFSTFGISGVSSAWSGAMGGDTVTITGTGYNNAHTYTGTFGSHTSASCTYVDSTHITCPSPAASSIGAVNVFVTDTTASLNSNTLANAYTYTWDLSLTASWVSTGGVSFRPDQGPTVVSGAYTMLTPPNAKGGFAGVVATQATGAKQPTVSANFNGSAFNAFGSTHASATSMLTGALTISQPYTVCAVFILTGSTASTIYAFADGLTSGHRGDFDITWNPSGANTTFVEIYAGGTALQAVESNTNLATGTAYWACAFLNNGSSGNVVFNGTTAATGSGAGTNTLDGITLFNLYPNSNLYAFQGTIAEIDYIQGAVTTTELTSGGASSFGGTGGYLHQRYGSPF